MSSDPVTVVYIAGAGRSGSTVLARLLGQMHGVIAVGEVRHFLGQRLHTLPGDVRCGCGESFPKCPFWTRVRERAVSESPSLDRDTDEVLARPVDETRWLPLITTGIGSKAFRQRLSKYERSLLAIYRGALIAGQGQVIVDESKHVVLLHLLAGMENIDLRVLHLVRDSRGVAYSWTKVRKRPEFTDKNHFMLRYSPTRSAAAWMYRNLAAGAVARRASRYARVRYEDLVSDPRTTLTEIGRALGIRTGALSFLDDGVANIVGDHIATGNPSRFNHGQIELRLDDAWKKRLPRRSQLLVTLLTWPLLLRYRYPLLSSRRTSK